MVAQGRGRRLLTLLTLLMLFAGFPTSAATPAKRPAKLVILLDRSGSMAKNDPQDLAVTGAQVLLSMLDPDDRVAVVAFDSTARTVLPLAPLGDGAAAKAALASLGRPTGQWTDIKGALGAATDLLAGPAPNGSGEAEAVPQAVLLFTDGKPETGPAGVPDGYREEMAALVSRMAGRNIPVFGVGLGQADFATLGQIATASRAESFAATSPTRAVQIFADVLSRIKERHVALAFDEDLSPGQVGQPRTLTVPPYTRLLTLSAVSTGAVKLTGRTPGGQPLTDLPGVKSVTGANYVVYTVPNPAPGLWTVQLEGTGQMTAHGQTESALRLRLLSPVPYSQVSDQAPVQLKVSVAGDPDPAAPLEVWAQGGGAAAVKLQPDRAASAQGAAAPAGEVTFTGAALAGDGHLAVWATRSGGEVARQQFRLYPTAAVSPPAPTAAEPVAPPWWRYPAIALAALALLLAFGGWNWSRIRRREEVVSGRLGSLTFRGAGREVLIGAGPAVLSAGAPQPLATISARLVPLTWAPLAGLGLGRRQQQIYIRPAAGVRLEINGRPPGDGRLYHGDEVLLGGESFTYSNPSLPRRPAVTAARRSGAFRGRPLNR